MLILSELTFILFANKTMAKLFLAFFICLLFSISHAQNPPTRSDPQSSNIQLPTDKPETDPETTSFVVNLDASDVKQLPPLTLLRFRPVNRHFQRRPLPLAIRRCRHSISYGNDMILSSDDTADRMPFGAGDRWAHFRRVDPRFPSDRGADIEWPPRHHHRRHYHHDRDHDHHGYDSHDENDHGLHEHGNGFLKSFRKFLGHF